MRLLRHPVFLAVALSHFIVDVLNGQAGILLAVLSVPLGLTNADIGLIATIYSLVGSLAQPVFGWLADRHGSRWATAGGVLWMALFFSLVAVAPGYWPIVCLVVGAVGSAAFHPPGTMRAAQVGHLHMTGQVATAASVFFLFGQGGLSVGPAVGGVLIESLGRPGLLLITAITVPIGLFTAWQLRPAPVPPAASPARSAPVDAPAGRPDRMVFILVMALASLRTAAQAILTTFAPKFFQDQGVSPAVYGAIVALYMGGSAIGGVFGGVLADRWGRRRTITLALLLSVLPFYFFPLASGGWIFLLAVLAGLFNGAPHSVFITMAQRALPGRAAMASGLTLGLMFAAGALGAFLGGLAADLAGLALVLQSTAALALAAAGLSLAVQPERRPVAVAAAD
jgi:FSR family fosmidomycin resistance protein-like MFS transporter